jgi:predicted nucleic acid-binding protein
LVLYLLDSNILVGFIRGADFAKFIDERYSISKPPNVALISVVSKGEIYSLAGQFRWGPKKTEELEKILRTFPVVDISDERILRRYAEIDVFSQGKDPSKPLGMSSRNMGKNDLWIAAAASVLKASLVTADSDFDHLDKIFLHLIRVNP